MFVIYKKKNSKKRSGLPELSWFHPALTEFWSLHLPLVGSGGKMSQQIKLFKKYTRTQHTFQLMIIKQKIIKKDNQVERDLNGE